MASSELILFEVPTIQIRLTGKKFQTPEGVKQSELKEIMNREKRNHRYYFKDDATYVADLEFAARIGKILLEQNKELEDHSKLLQEKIADQDAKILVRFLDTVVIQYLSELSLDENILILIFIKNELF